MLIAVSSLRDRPAFASLYLYSHNRGKEGKIATSLPQDFEASATQASFSDDGGLCLYSTKQVGGFQPKLRLYDVTKQAFVELPPAIREVNSLTHARLSGNGRFIAFCAWNAPGQSGGWDVLLFDRKIEKFVPIPGLNTKADEREVSLSGDARLVAFVSSRPDRTGLSEVSVYDRDSKKTLPLRGLNSTSRDLNPVLSSDGKLLAFISDRPGGAGGKDVYLYHLQSQQLEKLPALNSAAHEQSPAFSPDGRYLAFVSERTRGAGERDVYVYDRTESRFVDMPGLNSAAEDFDPAITYK